MNITFQNLFPMLSAQQLFQRLYPYEAMLGKEGRTAVEGILSVTTPLFLFLSFTLYNRGFCFTQIQTKGLVLKDLTMHVTKQNVCD